MRVTTPKNRIVPLVLFAIAGTVISLFFGMYQMNKLVQESYDSTVNSYDIISEETTAMLRKDIDDKCNELRTSAQLISRSGKLSRKEMVEYLILLSRGGNYHRLSIVGADGKGINSAGIDVDYSEEAFFLNTMRGGISITGGKDNLGKPVLIYSVPIYYNEAYLGALISTQKACLDMSGNQGFNSAGKESNFIYILDRNNELIAYLNEDSIARFDYEEMISGGYLHKKGDKHPPGYKVQLFNNQIEKRNNIVWYQKPFGINNWSVLIGKSDIISPVTQRIIRISNILWAVMLAGILIMFLMLIIYQRRSNQKLIQMLHLDPVTGGNNWYKFRMDVNKILNSRQFFKKKYALVNFDINRFKIINDSFGHQKGDEVLRDIYNLIKKWIKPGEPFTRYSADQFYILLIYQEPEEVNDRIKELNNRLHQLKFTKTVKFYYGVYYITERKDSIDRMGDFAGIAKHKIKGSGEDIISYFDDESRIRLLEEEKIEKTMHDALKNKEFVVYLQPKYTTVEEKITGAEALVRWDNGSGSLISPGFFIPVFEKNGFITELDMYMLKNVCRIQRGWMDKGYRPLPVSVNISRIHFTNPHLAEIIKDAVDEYQIPHELIELELSESAFLQNKQMLIDTVILLREYGFLVSMDDFGAGYSSLNSLKDLPLDVVKLDGELFRITDDVERGQTVIRNTISMAKDLHMKVVAECIETREQVEFLCTVGCDIIQGYYYAKPMPVEQFEMRFMEPVRIHKGSLLISEQ